MKFLPFCLFLLCLGSLPAQHFIPFQGKVFDADDQPVSGTHDFRFIINEPGLAWIEDHTDVPVYAGVYAVVLGSQNPLPDNLFQSAVVHTIEVSMDGNILDEVMIYKPIETDPTVDESVKDGVSWEEIADRPEVTEIPVGTVLTYAGQVIPDGWFECDGRTLATGDYPELFATLGYAWGGDEVANFNIPDFRGVFLRGANGTRNDAFADPDLGLRVRLDTGLPMAGLGSYQRDEFKEHIHGDMTRHGYMTWTPGHIPTSTMWWDNPNITRPSLTDGPYAIEPRGGNETRPKNAAVFFIIKVE